MSNWTKDDLFDRLRNIRRKTAGGTYDTTKGISLIQWLNIGVDILQTVNDDDGAHLVQLGYELRARQTDFLRDRIREVWLSDEQRRRAKGTRPSAATAVLTEMVQLGMTNAEIMDDLANEPQFESIRVFDRGDKLIFEDSTEKTTYKEIKKSSLPPMISRIRKSQ